MLYTDEETTVETTKTSGGKSQSVLKKNFGI